MNINKVSIIGAGHVGSNVAFLCLLKKICQEIVLVDIQKELAQGISFDLEDARYFSRADICVKGTDDFREIKGSDIIVVTAGKPRSPGMTRQDLIKINSGIIKDIANKIKEYSPGAILISVTNPLDLMTYVLLKETGFSKEKVIGMGSGLDSCRLANMLNKKSGISIENINPFVFGAHGKGMLVSSSSTIAGIQIDKFLSDEEFNEISQDTVSRGAAIVNLLKKGSARFGPAVSCLDLVESITYDKKKVSLCCTYLQGQYGMNNICLGVPVVLGRKGVEEIVELDISEKEKNLLKLTENTFQDQIKLV